MFVSRDITVYKKIRSTGEYIFETLSECPQINHVVFQKLLWKARLPAEHQIKRGVFGSHLVFGPETKHRCIQKFVPGLWMLPHQLAQSPEDEDNFKITIFMIMTFSSNYTYISPYAISVERHTLKETQMH